MKYRRRKCWLTALILVSFLFDGGGEATLSKSDRKKSSGAFSISDDFGDEVEEIPPKMRRQDEDEQQLQLEQDEPDLKAIILAEHDRLDTKGKRNFESGITLAYITPWNNHGYDVVKWAARKFTHISPVWFQLGAGLQDGQLTCHVGGTHDIDMGKYNEHQAQRERRHRMKKYKRYAMIGAATGLGGVLIGVTGGLAAPLILSSVSALTATAILLPGAASAAIFGSVFGAAGAGLTGYRMQKRVGDIEEFSIERLTEQENQSLHCVLCVSGWIEDREERAFRHHWRHLWMSKEQYTLRWESKYLEELGKSIDYFVSFVVSYAIQRSLMETVLVSLVSAIAWPLVLLGSSCVIDNPWNICTRRASQVGEHLAEVLLTRAHGRRPITLIGFSLGARVIYHCLLEMSKRAPDSLGIVEDVILLGAPVSASPSQWRQLCSVVGGRVINGYCKTDWLLRFLYRTMSVQFIIAGTGPVDNRKERKIVNFNLSHIVKGHLDYAKKLSQVLEAVGVRCTPLSHASRADLAEAEKESGTEEAEKETRRADSSRIHSFQNRRLDESSMVVERVDGLHIGEEEVKVGGADEEEEGEQEEDGRRKRKNGKTADMLFVLGNNHGKGESCEEVDIGEEVDEQHDPLGVERAAAAAPELERSVSSADSYFSTVSSSAAVVEPPALQYDDASTRMDYGSKQTTTQKQQAEMEKD